MYHYKIAFFLFYVVCVCGVITSATNALEQQLFQLFQIWRAGDLQSLPFQLPALDKIVIQPFEGQYNKMAIKMGFSTSEMELTGLDSFIINSLRASDETLEASISLRILNATLYADKYKLSGRAYYVYPLKGAGNMTVKFQDINIFASLQLGTNGTSLWMSNLKFDYTIEKVEGELSGSSWPINRVLKSDATDILESYHDDIVKAVVTSALPYANEFLGNLSLHELLTMFLVNE